MAFANLVGSGLGSDGRQRRPQSHTLDARIGASDRHRSSRQQSASVVADSCKRVSNRQNVGDHGDNYNRIHVEEVIDSKNNDQRELSVITSRLQQPVNRL